MTCIVGIVKDGEVWMGGDGAMFIRDDLAIEISAKKVAIIDGRFLMGMSGTTRPWQIMRAMTYPEHPDGVSDEEYMTLSVISAITEELRKNNLLGHDDENHCDCAGHCEGLIGYRARLYTLDSGFNLDEYRQGVAGSGVGVGLGALTATELLGIESPERRIRIVLQAAARHLGSVGEPFTILRLPALGPKT